MLRQLRIGLDMEKQKKWPFFTILIVIALTIYNILPTIFYYSQPLSSPVDEPFAKKISLSIKDRVNQLETETQDWLHSFCNLLEIQPKAIAIHPENPQFFTVSFIKSEDAAQFRSFLPRAGSLIPLSFAQLSLAPQTEYGKEVVVQRKISARLEESFFSFSPKNAPEILDDRINQLGLALAGPSDAAICISQLQKGGSPESFVPFLAAEINSFSQVFGEDSSIASRYAARFTQGAISDRFSAIQLLIQSFEKTREDLKKRGVALHDAKVLPEEKEAAIRLLEKKEKDLSFAETYLKNHAVQFSSGKDPWDLYRNNLKNLGNRNPLFSNISVDLAKEEIVLTFHSDVAAFRKTGKNKELFEQLLINEIAKIGHISNEKLVSNDTAVTIPLYHFPNASGFLVFNLERLAQLETQGMQSTLRSLWHPKHPDLQNLPIVDFAAYEKLSDEEKALCLVILSPLSSPTSKLNGLQNSSLYFIGKGFHKIFQNYELFPDSEWASLFHSDLASLEKLLHQQGFSSPFGISHFGEWIQPSDTVLEKQDWTASFLAATRENFIVRGTKKYALLELSDREQRILTQNKIETQIHEDLLKWNDEYRAAQVNLDARVRFDTPKPTRNSFLNNCKLSLTKLFRGDERKIIRWGLDLSGGKTVQIELRDQNHRVVTDDADIRQGINELHSRINKMGLSEVSIRQMGTNIVLDFPSSQALSASELIKASSMYFHVINEKFSLSNPSLSDSVNRFLQEVWNEASVLENKDPQHIHAIAYTHLHEEAMRTEAAKTLWDNGLRFASPQNLLTSNALDTTLSKVAIFRGADSKEWQGQSHPLLIVFHNYVIEGSNLDNIQAGYDSSKGNYLNFEVRGSYNTKENQKINPRSALLSWTTFFSKDMIAGSSLENFSRGHGWRMAVALNDSVISSPTLNSPLETGGMISGSFSQREVNQLAADLKAGSLTFTPHILSEKNVSPELGQQDRIQGISATFIALLLVVFAMTAYYRFAGVVASVAVIFNLLILWATLQNLGAALTLAGLAGIILTVGMAVDANVLVFERIKEEFALSGRISSALSIGYKKAYSAIIDSNLTTIIAALILLNFDAGPIKSFAINLIIGIVSSMFTALFMTRFYFTRWAQNPKNKELKMANWIHATKFDFLKYSKVSFILATLVILMGSFLALKQKNSILGMDFTGGYAINLEIDPLKSGECDYSKKVEKALLASGAISSDFQIRELNPKNHLRILFGTSMEQLGKPFSHLPLDPSPRLQWVVQALQKENLLLTSDCLSHLDTHWTAMSGQMSHTMRNSALYGLFISFVCIFIYLSFRFEYKFATAALLCLFHDVLITIGSIGLLHALGVPVQIDLNTIAALMTIIGYSLNDTIIIFDRVREEMQTAKNQKFDRIVNQALNATLSRTSMTSGTTLLVLLALVVLGGSSIFSFALVMTIGVFFGTLSSWFIAAPLLLFFQKKEESREMAEAPL